MPLPRRPPVSFIAWAPVAGRSVDIAAALGGTARCIYDARLRHKPFLLVRYLVSAARTVAHLAVRRPRAVIVTNPPIYPGLLCWAYTRIGGAPLLLDSHPTAFGEKRNIQDKVMGPVHRWLVRRAQATLVTTEALVGQVEAWGGRGLVVHEPPAALELTPVPDGSSPYTVLFAGTFAGDEPVAELFEAARRVPEIRIRVTGRPEKAPRGLLEDTPANVELLGYLDPTDYRGAIEQAHAVMVLTTDPSSVMRAAYEGVYAGRPIIVSDWPVLREVFPDALHADNDGATLASAMAQTRDRAEELAALAPDARARQLDRWRGQLDALWTLIREPAGR